MSHQKCRLCGDNHPLGPCPKFSKKEHVKNLLDTGAVSVASDLEKQTLLDRIAELEAKLEKAPKFDKKAYQREYMRKKRLAERSKS